MHITYVSSESPAKDITTYWFRTQRDYRYQAGQYTEVTIPHKNPDKKGMSRWFTLSSSPSEDLISITLKHKQEPESTFRQALKSLTVESAVTIGNPIGDFMLPVNKNIPLIFIASGIGITPVRSIIKWLSDNGEERSVQIFYIIKNKEEAAYLELLESYESSLTVFLTNPSKSWSGHTGRPTADEVISLSRESQNSLYYLSGIQSMVEEMQYDLINKHGINRNKIILDYFPGYTDL